LKGTRVAGNFKFEETMTRLLPYLTVFLAATQAAELPVREVILYKSGVGYFERQGQIAAGESARLNFKAEEMNDVLKSLAISDLNGGKFTGLRYDSALPLNLKLGEFPFKLGENQSLSGFLDQVKGAEVEMKSGGAVKSGTVVGARTVTTSDKAQHEKVVLMLGTGDLETFDLADVTSLKFADPKLQLQLKDYLSALNQARSQDKRSVYIDSTDAKSQNIVASYMVPAPVWKSSYRLIFGDKPEPTLEGWAIVDNTTGDDWTNIKLAVVSGRPVSFISRLYEPKFLERPTVELAEDAAVRPTVYDAAMAAPSAGLSRMEPMAKLDKAKRSFNALGNAAQMLEVQAAAPRQASESTLNVTTEGRDLGELFEYRFSAPVTVKKNESAMLPFLQQPVGARKLLIYREENGLNPMSAAEITNSTGKTLAGGPITVFEAGGYSGEALIETVKTGEKRLISYAVDLGARVTTNFDSNAEVVRTIHLNRGILTSTLAAEETRTYTIKNVDQKAKTLIIEHPLRQGYRLLNQKPAETTPNAYRFEVKLSPDSTQALAVREERVYLTQTAVSNLTPDVLMTYVENKGLADLARRELGQISDQKTKIAEIDGEILQAEGSLNDANKDEERIRQNIDSLRRVSGQDDLVKKYALQLADQENKIAALRDKISQLKRTLAGLQSQLNTLIAKLEF
jgi:hypothetical protein